MFLLMTTRKKEKNYNFYKTRASIYIQRVLSGAPVCMHSTKGMTKTETRNRDRSDCLMRSSKIFMQLEICVPDSVSN